MKKVFLFWALGSLVFILSCSSGGSSSGISSETGPTISNLSLGQNRAVFGQSGGIVRTTAYFEYLGGGGDLTTSLFYYDNNGNPVFGTPAPIRGVNGSTRGSSYGNIDIPTLERKTITVKVFVTDSRGRVSNWLSAPFDIL